MGLDKHSLNRQTLYDRALLKLAKEKNMLNDGTSFTKFTVSEDELRYALWETHQFQLQDIYLKQE